MTACSKYKTRMRKWMKRNPRPAPPLSMPCTSAQTASAPVPHPQLQCQPLTPTAMTPKMTLTPTERTTKITTTTLVCQPTQRIPAATPPPPILPAEPHRKTLNLLLREIPPTPISLQATVLGHSYACQLQILSLFRTRARGSRKDEGSSRETPEGYLSIRGYQGDSRGWKRSRSSGSVVSDRGDRGRLGDGEESG